MTDRNEVVATDALNESHGCHRCISSKFIKNQKFRLHMAKNKNFRWCDASSQLFLYHHGGHKPEQETR